MWWRWWGIAVTARDNASARLPAHPQVTNRRSKRSVEAAALAALAGFGLVVEEENPFHFTVM